MSMAIPFKLTIYQPPVYYCDLISHVISTVLINERYNNNNPAYTYIFSKDLTFTHFA